MPDVQAIGNFYTNCGHCLLAGFYVITNCICVFFYAWDKSAASRRAPRVAEMTLFFWTLIAGGISALLAQTLFRHKTRKPFFQFIAIFAMLIHIGIIIFWLSPSSIT